MIIIDKLKFGSLIKNEELNEMFEKMIADEIKEWLFKKHGIFSVVKVVDSNGK